MPWKSYAQWPKGVFVENPSTDTHDTEEAAKAVCEGLKRDGFGGEGKHFPIRTWVNEVDDDGNIVRRDCNLCANIDHYCYDCLETICSQLCGELQEYYEERGKSDHPCIGCRFGDEESREHCCPCDVLRAWVNRYTEDARIAQLEAEVKMLKALCKTGAHALNVASGGNRADGYYKEVSEELKAASEGGDV